MPNGISIPTNWTEVKNLVDSGWRLYHSKQIRGTRFNYAVYCTNDEPGGVSFNTSLKHSSVDLVDFEANYLPLSNKPFVPSTVLDSATNTFVPSTVQILQTSVQSVLDTTTNTIVPLTAQQAGTVSISPNENTLLLLEHFKNLALSDEIAVNGLPTNTLNIWDGSGVGDVGTSDFIYASDGIVTEQIVASHSGTNGLDIQLDDKKYIDFSGVIDASNYEVFSFWLNVQSGWESKDRLKMELFLSGAKQGKKINVRNYMTSEDQGIWQEVKIPISDFGNIGTIDTIKFKADHDKYFYFDDFVISTNGSGNTDLTYSVRPLSTEKYLIDFLTITMIVDNDEWEPLSFGSMNALSSGLGFELYKNGSLYKNIVIKSNSDIIELSDGVRNITGKGKSSKSFDLKISTVLDGSKNEHIDIIVSDDISKVISLKALVVGTKVDL